MRRAGFLTKFIRSKSSFPIVSCSKGAYLECNLSSRCHRFLGPYRSHVVPRLQMSIVPYKLSDIGEGIKEVVIKEWFIKEGDTVNQFDQICEVQSDKASVTITSRYDGIVRKLYYEVDETAQVGLPFVDIEVTEEEDTSSSLDSITENIADSEGQELSDPFERQKTPVENESLGKVLATPVVRRMASEMKIDLTTVFGTGPKGRVLKEDLINFQSKEPKTAFIESSECKTPTSFTSSFQPAPVASSHDTVVKLTAYQKGMHKAMTSSLQIPHFTYSDEVNMNSLVAMKRELKSIGKKMGVKITLLPFMIKAASLALKQYPQINAHYLPEEEVVLLKGSHNVGVAIDTPQGLLVPNIKNCEVKSVVEIAHDLNELQKLADDGNGKVSFQQSHLSGGTFSLSNIGFLGGTYTKPVIAPPEVAIGAIGRIQVLPRFELVTHGSKDNYYENDYKVVPTNVLNISWSADHRVLDGATICRFSNLWKSYLENPKLMLLYLK